MRITKVYTKQGDNGLTQLVDGSRVYKDSARVSAYGDVDELNSFIGYLRIKVKEYKEIDEKLKTIQNDLFIIGSDLATPMSFEKTFRIEEGKIKILENWIDEYNEKLEPLKDFILPYGNEKVSLFHICRTITRRAERNVVRLMKEEEVNKNVLVYLNRLSDLFFVLARYVAKLDNIEEEYVSWK
ncbi:MAG: cob(I)yrinic acid a,c-diamide adenosyltransferase [candidate division WOR-3 bacterium]|nr:cob(I)yrinic acid a,c-diamide adenosyltransferase [candidate division WOR-3 bacterium]